MSLSFANLFRLGGEKNVPPSIFRPLSFPLSLSLLLSSRRAGHEKVENLFCKPARVSASAARLF